MMMKRLLLSTGLLILLLPKPAAATDSAVCQALADTDPVSSHYVAKVLERKDEGLRNIRSASANPDFERYLPSWARVIGGMLNSLADTRLTITLEESDLLEATACLHVDALLLDCALLEAQDELQAQLKKNSIWGIMQTEALLEFLKERKVHLLRGALNPRYEDPTWNDAWRFERSGSSSSSSSSEAPGLCPFDSDYAPPAADGYGCDADVLQRIEAYAPAKAEREALEALEEELQKYKDLASEFSSLERELEELYGGEPSAPAPPPQEEVAEHREISGCQDEPPEEGLRLRSVRSPFSYKKNDIGILSDFLAQRTAEGLFREQSDELKLPSEFEDAEEQERREKTENPLLQLFRNGARQFFRTVSGLQGKKEASSFAASPDATLEAANALGDLRESVGELSRLAGPKEGLRSFVIRYAYFLRRTCIYRPCNTSLERVLRTAYADECFPYTDGEFLGDSEGNPRWKQCAEAACIRVDGVNLPGSCNDVLP